MDDELRRLQEQLAAVQMQETAYRLSERNVVEIVLKLLETQKVELIFAKSGREYLTPKQLGLEIEDELMAHGGRVTLVELQPILNVDMNHIEERVAHLLAKDRSLRLVNGQLVTNYYLDGILEETNDALQDLGQVSISSLVQKYSLPAELILEAVNARLGSIIFGRLEGMELYTETFVQRHNGRVRGIFSAITVPVTLRSIIQLAGLLESLTYSEVARLIEDKLLAGSLQGTQERSTYIPFSYARNQKGSVESFFNQNGYIEYTALSKLQISNPQEYMSRTFPSGLKLSSAYLGEVYVEQAVGAVEEAVAENKWTDVTSVLPPPLSSKDVELVVKKAVADANQSVAKGKKAIQMAEVFAVSEGFLAEAASRLQPLVRATAVKSMAGDDDADEDAQSETSAASGSSAKGKKDSKPAKKGGKGKSKAEDSDDEPDARSKAKKGGKRGKDAEDSDEEDSKKRPSKAKGKKKGKADDSDDEAPVEKPSKAKSSKKAAGAASISIAAIIRQLQSEFPDLPPELAEAIADNLKPALSTALLEFVKSIASGGSSDRRERLEFLTRTLQETFDHLSVFHRASLLFLPANQRKAVLGDEEEDEDSKKDAKKKSKDPITMLDETEEKGLGAAGDPATVAVLQKHILKTTASQAFDQLLECAAVSHDLINKLGLSRPAAPAQSATTAPVHHSVSSDSLASADGKPNTPQQSAGAGAGKAGSTATSPPIAFSANDRTRVLGQLPANVAKPLKLLQGLLAGKSSSEFVDKFESAAGDCEVRVKRPDKKRERNIVFGVRRGLMSQLEHVPRPELVLHYAVVILHSQVHNAVVHAPSRSIPVLLRSLNGFLNPEAAATLTAYSERVQRLLRASHTLKLQQLLRDERAQAQSQSAKPPADDAEEDEEEKKPRGGKRSVQFAEPDAPQPAAPAAPTEEEEPAAADEELMEEDALDKLRQEQQALATELEADKEKVRALGMDPKKAVK